MKVLQVHLSDGHQGGGGGIAMLMLHRRLQEAGIDSHILCRTKTLDSPHVSEVPRPSRSDYLLKRVTSPLGLNDIHLVSSFKVKQLEAFQEADVIDFQGIHTNTLSYLSLPALTRNKSSVFTLHDMWGLTGHCTYSYDCTRWKSGCGKCPYPQTHPAIKRDNTRLEWHLKKQIYNRSNVVFAAGSQWMVDMVKESMVDKFPVYLIPYGIDVNAYQPLDKDACRAELGIPPNKNVLMFAALKLGNHRKGGDLLVEALKELPSSVKANTVLLTIGNGGKDMESIIGMQTINLGYVHSDHRKAVAYSAADLFLFPTRADTFGMVSIESQACGTPVVSFDVSGVPDHVRPGETGYLAKPEDATDFRKGILELLSDHSLRQTMMENGRAMTVKEFSLELRVQRYIRLYKQLMKNELVPTRGDMVSVPLEFELARSM